MKLPASIQVLERGWLSANNVLLHDASESTVIDSGYGAHAEQTLQLLAHALGARRLERLVNTHCHSDHMGGNAAIQRAHACRTGIPAGEAAAVDDWDEQSLVLDFADQRAERFRYDEVFRAGEVLRMGGLDWQVLAAPGHDTHAVMFYAPEARMLISGDALWENGFGVVFPRLFGRETALAETRSTLETIAALGVDAVIPGHGRVFTEVGRAVERALERVAYYEADLGRLARHCVKVLLAFALLEKRSMALAELPGYVQRVPVYRDINERWLGMAPQALAEWLAAELERAGVARRGAGRLVAA